MVFNRVIDWRYSQSCWYFRPALGTIAPLSYSLVSSHPRSTRTQCVMGEYGVIGGEGASDRQNNCCKVPLQVNLTFDITFCQSYLSTGTAQPAMNVASQLLSWGGGVGRHLGI